ncbi:MAG: D-alanyl-D-alanine carboxypeptidase [Alphaproteobacteria bacterium]
MTIRWRWGVLVLALAVLMTTVPDAEARKRRPAKAAPVDRYAAIVVDAATGEVLHQKNADAPRHPASITKIMTLYLLFEALDQGRLKLNSQMPVSAYAAARPPTKLGLKAGGTLSVEDAILGLVTKSANDAASVVAEALGGNEAAFAKTMTLRARRLGMHDTVFQNASGLPDSRQVTTARDFTVLARAMLRDHPRRYQYFSTRGFTFAGEFHHNHNRLMDQFDGMDGIKTGFINASGFNLVASAKRDGRRLVGVVMGGSSARGRDAQMAELLEASFRRPAPRHEEPVAIASVVPARKPVSLTDSEPLRLAIEERVEVAEFRTASGPAPALRRPDPKPDPKPEAKVEPVAEAKGGAKFESTDGWSIQVGAFSRHDSARRAIQSAQRKAGRLLRDAAATVMSPDDKLFRARFVGMEEREARAACRQLGERVFPCAVIAPSAATVAEAR